MLKYNERTLKALIKFGASVIVVFYLLAFVVVFISSKYTPSPPPRFPFPSGPAWRSFPIQPPRTTEAVLIAVDDSKKESVQSTGGIWMAAWGSSDKNWDRGKTYTVTVRVAQKYSEAFEDSVKDQVRDKRKVNVSAIMQAQLDPDPTFTKSKDDPPQLIEYDGQPYKQWTWSVVGHNTGEYRITAVLSAVVNGKELKDTIYQVVDKQYADIHVHWTLASFWDQFIDSKLPDVSMLIVSGFIGAIGGFVVSQLFPSLKKLIQKVTQKASATPRDSKPDQSD